MLGRVYECFLGKFAAAEGKLGGEFFTPWSIVRLMVEITELFKCRVYDPACGSGGMFVQSERFSQAMATPLETCRSMGRSRTQRRGGPRA